MSEQAATPSAKARIVAAHRRAPAPSRGRLAERAWDRTLRRAAMPFDGLGLQPTALAVQWDQRVDAVTGALPAQGLVVMLEDSAGRRGVLAMDHGMIDALVEVQTTGRVDPQQGPIRPITKIDTALCRDFIDLTMSHFATEQAAVPDRDWPDRMAFGSTLPDRHKLGLLLPDQAYHIFSADLTFGVGGRGGQMVLASPVDRSLIKVAAAHAPAPDGPWRAAVARVLADTAIPLNVILLRVTRPLAVIEGMKPGDLIPFDASDLGAVRVEDAQGRTVFNGRLGQIGGKRAVRLGSGEGVVSDAPRPADDGGDLTDHPHTHLPKLGTHPALAKTLDAQADGG